MSMKYRIRNMKSGKIVAPVQLELSYNYLMGTDGIVYDDEFFPMPNHKAEMEVADGVFEGDYLLSYLGDDPMIYHVESYGRLTIVGTNTKYSGIVKGFLRGVDFEVIKCR